MTNFTSSSAIMIGGKCNSDDDVCSITLQGNGRRLYIGASCFGCDRNLASRIMPRFLDGALSQECLPNPCCPWCLRGWTHAPGSPAHQFDGFTLCETCIPNFVEKKNSLAASVWLIGQVLNKDVAQVIGAALIRAA
jgi:hypothetical protein